MYLLLTQYKPLNIKQFKDQLFQNLQLERKSLTKDLSNMRQNLNIRHQLFTPSSPPIMSNKYLFNKEFFLQHIRSLNKQRKFLHFWILRDNQYLQSVWDKVQMMSIQDMQPTTVSKDHLVQKFQQETKLLKVNKTKSKPQEILETLLERIKTTLKEGFQLSKKTKDFLTLNLNSMNRIWEETWINGSLNPNIFSKLSLTTEQMFSTLKFTKDRILKTLWMNSEESTIWVKMQREDFSIRSNNRSIIDVKHSYLNNIYIISFIIFLLII